LPKSKSDFVAALKGAERPALVIGQGALSDPATLAAIAVLAKSFNVVQGGWNGWNVLHTAAARVGGLDMGFVPKAGGKSATELARKGAADVLFLLGADELDLSRTDAFVVYLGTHGDAGAHRADVILPGAAYTEKNGLYVNTEGRVQQGVRAVFPKGQAKEDWAILRALSEVLEHKLPYDNRAALRAAILRDAPHFKAVGEVPVHADTAAATWEGVGAAGALDAAPLAGTFADYYLTNPIARASETMAKCSQEFAPAT
jgi:NADH-quinone oxidoreductase subunit G